MTLFWLICVFFAGLMMGVILGARVSQNSTRSVMSGLVFDMTGDKHFLLKVLRRELANWLISVDPDRFYENYQKSHGLVEDIAKADRINQMSRLKIITDKLPYYSDFDFLMGQLEYVSYNEGFSFSSYDEIESHYNNIIEFEALQIALFDEWKRFRAISERDVLFLGKYVKKLKDSQLREKIDLAIKDFMIYSQGKGCATLDYETAQLRVFRLPHYAETRYGIHFKDSSEFAICGVFVFDNGESSTSYFRSDERFGSQILLDTL